MSHRTISIQNSKKTDNAPLDSVAKKGFSSFDIQLTRVNASYENRRTGKLDVLHDISFTVHAGRRLVIMGENGSGKTTLLRVLAGLLPYEGSILYGQRELRTIPTRTRAGLVCLMSQLTQSYYPYTVRETIMLGRYSKIQQPDSGHNSSETTPTQKVISSKSELTAEWLTPKTTPLTKLFSALTALSTTTGKADEKKVDALLKDMNLLEIKDKRIDTLSGGQLQRVFLARAYAQDTPVMLLDEPMSHLDLRYQDELSQRLLHEKKHRTVIGVFHDLYMAAIIAEEVVLLKEGHLLYSGEAKAVFQNNELLSDAFGTDLSRRLTFI